MRRRLAQLAFDRGGLVALATLVLYVWLAPVHVVDGDNAELATLGTIGGIAHPSGYPVFLLWLRATSWIPGETPAHTTAIATAFLGALQILVLHAACRAWGARAIAATVAVAIFAAGPVVLRMYTEAEVFALNGLVAATVLWLAAASGPLRGARRAALLGLVAGLGLSDHMTCVLVAPVGLLGVVRGMREAAIPKAAVAGIAIAGLVVGLAPYLYLVVEPETALSWGRIDSLDELIGHITRRYYGGPGAFAARAETTSVIDNLVALGRTLGRSWLWAPAIVGLGALGLRSVKPARDGEPRWGWAMLALSWLAAGPLLAARFNVAPVGVGLYVCQRFYLLPALLLTIPIAVGLERLAAPLVRHVPGGVRSLAVSSSLATLGFVAMAGASLSYVRAVHSPAVEQGARNALRTLPANAVVIVASDDFYAGTGYVQHALGERPDVLVVDWPLVELAWYRTRLARAGFTLDPQGRGLADQVLAAGRPLFVDSSQGAVLAAYPNHPYGILVRVLPRGTPRPELDTIVELNRALYARFELDYPTPGKDDELATEMHKRYAVTWSKLARALADAGQPERAQQALALAHQLGPQP